MRDIAAQRVENALVTVQASKIEVVRPIAWCAWSSSSVNTIWRAMRAEEYIARSSRDIESVSFSCPKAF